MSKSEKLIWLSRIYGCLAILALVTDATEVSVATLIIVATVIAVGGSILKELGR